MFKKGISLLLAMFILITFSTTIFAAVPTDSNDLNDTTWTGSYWADNFDRYTEDVESGETLSDVFTISAGANTKIDADGGRNGSAAVVVTSDTTGSSKLTFNVAERLGSMQVGQIAVVRYDIKFSGLTNMTDNMWLSGGRVASRQFARVTTGGNFYLMPDTNGSAPHSTAVTENAWYTVIVTINKMSGEDGDYEQRSISIYDENGAYCAGITNTQKEEWSDTQAKTFYIQVPATSEGTTAISVDNASLAYYDMTKYAPGLTQTPAIANQKVRPIEQKIAVTLDQPISGVAKATLKNLTDNTTDDVICYTNATTIESSVNRIFDAVSPFDYTVTVPASALDYGTDYELVLDGFKNHGGTASTASVLFSTLEKSAGDEGITIDFSRFSLFHPMRSGSYYVYNPLLSYYTDTRTTENGYLQVTGVGKNNYTVIRTSPVNEDHPEATPLKFSDPDKAYVLSYRMRVDSPAEGDLVADFAAGIAIQDDSVADYQETAEWTNFAAEFQSNANGHIVKQDLVRDGEQGAAPGTWQADTWYKVIWSVAGGVQTYRLYDETTHALIFERTRAIGGEYSAEQNWSFFLVEQHNTVNPNGDNGHELESGTACSAGFSLDDVTLWTFDKTQDWSKPRYASNLVDGENVILTFDQPLLATGADYTVTNNTTGEVEQGVTVSVTQLSDSSQKLSFDGLDYNTTYTLNYKDITNIAGQSLANESDAPAITFTTGAYDIADGYVIVGNPTVSGKTQGSTIGIHVYCPAPKTGSIFVALYDEEDKLLGVEQYDLNAETSGKVADASVTLSKDYTTAASMKIFAWTNDLKPELLPVVRTIEE